MCHPAGSAVVSSVVLVTARAPACPGDGHVVGETELPGLREQKFVPVFLACPSCQIKPIVTYQSVGLNSL